MCESPENTESHRSDSSRFTTTLLASPTPQRHFSLDHLQSPTRTTSDHNSLEMVLYPEYQQARQSPQVFKLRARSDTVFSNFSTTSTASSGFDQKSYKELFNNINDKINLVVRKYVYIDPSVGASLGEVESFLDLAGRHVNYRKVAVLISQTSHLQPPLVHGMIWRLINDLIFDTPVLDQAPSPYAQAFLVAWNQDVKCCTIQADDWSIKGPLMEARINAARRVFENTPRFNEWIKSFASTKTNQIVQKLTIAFAKNVRPKVCSELNEPITKLVRIALRMRCELKAFEFKFYEYATKAASDHMVLCKEFNHMPAPGPEKDDIHHVVCTKIPQVFEKDYRPQTKSKTCIYKAEVVAREKYPGYNDNMGDRYRRSNVRKSVRTYRSYNV